MPHQGGGGYGPQSGLPQVSTSNSQALLESWHFDRGILMYCVTAAAALPKQWFNENPKWA